MIKIELNSEKKKRIEVLFLKDLVEGTPRGKQQRKQGKLIEALNTEDSHRLLQQCNTTLYNYLYKKRTGEPNTENVKALLLADRRKMERFIRQFGPVSTSNANDLLNTVFCYTNFSNRKVVNEILQEMDVQVCPYCNRLYVTVLKRGKVRPPVGSFLSPVTVSLFGLMPV